MLILKKQRINMDRIKFISGFVFSLLVLNCTSHKEKPTFYRAINKTDTAYLKISKLDEQYFGSLEIHYGGAALKDSGTVSGVFKKDTLKLIFHYLPHTGGERKRKPLSLLQKDNKLLMGKGHIITFMEIAQFDTKTPIDYSHPEFVFEEVKK